MRCAFAVSHAQGVSPDTRAQDVGARLESADDMDESPAAGKRHRVDGKSCLFVVGLRLSTAMVLQPQ